MLITQHKRDIDTGNKQNKLSWSLITHINTYIVLYKLNDTCTPNICILLFILNGQTKKITELFNPLPYISPISIYCVLYQ